jgi:hypothetical protein
MERPAVAERDEIVVSSDAVALEAMFEDLTKRKEDDQVLHYFSIKILTHD